MSRTVADMSETEFRSLLGEVVEQKLAELIHDPEEGLAFTPEVQARLERQLQRVEAGERGVPLADLLASG